MVKRVQRDMGNDPTWLQVVSTKTGAAPDLKPTTQLETARSVDPTEAFIQPEWLHSSYAPSRAATKIIPSQQARQLGTSATEALPSKAEAEMFYSPKSKEMATTPPWKPAPGGPPPPMPSVPGIDAPYPLGGPPPALPWRRPASQVHLRATPEGKLVRVTPAPPTGVPPIPFSKPAAREREMLHDALRAAGFENPSSILDAFEAAQK